MSTTPTLNNNITASETFDATTPTTYTDTHDMQKSTFDMSAFKVECIKLLCDGHYSDKYGTDELEDIIMDVTEGNFDELFIVSCRIHHEKLLQKLVNSPMRKTFDYDYGLSELETNMGYTTEDDEQDLLPEEETIYSEVYYELKKAYREKQIIANGLRKKFKHSTTRTISTA